MKRQTLAPAVAIGAVWLFASQVQAQLLPGEREAKPTPIAGVIDGSARWELVWSDVASADGIVGEETGVLFAQEQTDRIVYLDNQNSEYTYLENVYGVGSISVDSDGRMFAVERTCTEPLNPELAGCNILTRVVQVLPTRRVLANRFADGSPLGRLNDLIADGSGGAFFTVGGVYHVSATGTVAVVADQDIRTNGIMLSPDGQTLYVTNGGQVIAFDVNPDGSTQNRRVFGTLAGDMGGDGMAIDAEGRLYVTAAGGVHVLSSSGSHLGVIPTPRRGITVAFAGPGKQWLYVPQIGAIGPDGQPYTTPEGIRNIAMSIYRIRMVARGFAGRPK
jgi:gluconolactonase